MRIIDLLDKLDNEKLLNPCVVVGVIPLKVTAYRDIFRRYEFEYSQLKIKSIEQAMCNVCEDLQISRSQVVRARKYMMSKAI